MVSRTFQPISDTAGPIVKFGSPEDAGDIAFIVGVFRKNRRLILKCAAAGLLLGVVTLALAPKSFKATSVVLLDFKRLAALDENFSTASGRIDSSAVLSQIEIMKSGGVIDNVVATQHLDQDPEFAGDGFFSSLLQQVGLSRTSTATSDADRKQMAADAFSKALKVERVDLSYTIAVTVTSKVGEKAARLANAVTTGYIEDQLNAKRIASEEASGWFKKRIADLQKNVSDADQTLNDYKTTHNIVTSDGKFVDEQQVADLGQKMLQASFARASAEAKVVQIDTIMKSGATQSALIDEFSNEVIVKLRDEFLEAERKAADLAQRVGASHEAVKQYEDKAAGFQRAMNDEFQRIQAGAKNDAAIARGREQNLDDQMKELTAHSRDVGQSRVRLMQLQSLSDAVKTIRDTFLSRYVDSIQKQSFPMTEARVISLATEPSGPTFPTPIKAILGGLLIGFGGGFMWGVGRETFSRRITHRHQVESASGVPCLGFLPNLGVEDLSAERDNGSPLKDDAFNRTITGTSRAASVYLETLRNVKICLDAHQTEGPFILGIVSVGPSEGKSRTALSLSKLLSRHGMPTLLVDGDRRNRNLSRQLAADEAAGRKETAATEPFEVFATRDANLNFLANLSPSKAIDEDFTSVIRRALQHADETSYRYIVVDLPLLSAFSDARAVSSLIDGFLLVVKWGSTESHVVSEALEANQAIREKLVGSLVNQANIDRLAYLQEPSVIYSAQRYS